MMPSSPHKVQEEQRLHRIANYVAAVAIGSFFGWMIGLVAATNAHGFMLYTSVYRDANFRPGAEVKIGLYPDLCKPAHIPDIESRIHYFNDLMSFLDPTRTWTYVGHQDHSGYGVWDDDIVTIDCKPKEEMGGRMGMGSPKIDPTHQYLGEGYVTLNSDMFDWEVGQTTLHELGHAVLAFLHSNQQSATMQPGSFQTIFSSQLMETFGYDDLCAIRQRYLNSGEDLAHWPPYRHWIDDLNNLYIPYAPYGDSAFEFWMIRQDDNSYLIRGDREAPSCDQLNQDP